MFLIDKTVQITLRERRVGGSAMVKTLSHLGSSNASIWFSRIAMNPLRVFDQCGDILVQLVERILFKIGDHRGGFGGGCNVAQQQQKSNP